MSGQAAVTVPLRGRGRGRGYRDRLLSARPSGRCARVVSAWLLLPGGSEPCEVRAFPGARSGVQGPCWDVHPGPSAEQMRARGAGPLARASACVPWCWLRYPLACSKWQRSKEELRHGPSSLVWTPCRGHRAAPSFPSPAQSLETPLFLSGSRRSCLSLFSGPRAFLVLCLSQIPAPCTRTRGSGNRRRSF